MIAPLEDRELSTRKNEDFIAIIWMAEKCERPDRDFGICLVLKIAGL